MNQKTGEEGRHHVDESLVQKAVRDAVVKAGLTKRATCHVPPFLRHPLARRRVRYPDGPGTPGSQRRYDDDDLHPCPQPWAGRRTQPR